MTELACQVVVERGDTDRQEGALDLVLLDTETGARRVLAQDVQWGVPCWAADGRTLSLEGHEVDVEDGSIRDRDEPVPDPGVSPDGAWTAGRDPNGLLSIVSRDGTSFALPLGFTHWVGEICWAPDGTRLALGLTANMDTGVHVLDLRTGARTLVTPAIAPYPEVNPTHGPSGWTADGTAVLVTENRWHDPTTYDYELNDLWSFAADGTGGVRLTTDGRCARAAARPDGTAPTPEMPSLTFEWAESLPGPAGPGDEVALWAELVLDPNEPPPFSILVALRIEDGTVEGVRIDDCTDIPDGFAQLDALLADRGAIPGDGFCIVLPRYVADTDDAEQALNAIAGLVLTEVEQRHWAFDRERPPDEPAG